MFKAIWEIRSPLLLLAVLPTYALAAEKAEKTGTIEGAGNLVPLSSLGIPHYEPPASYREDLVIHTKDGTFTMKRSIDHGKIRTDMDQGGQKMAMIEMGDEAGTMITLQTDQKRAMKMTRAGAEDDLAKMGKKAPKVDAAPSASDLQAEDLGEETIDGVAAKKVRMKSEGGDVLGWFDKATGAPLRMESTVDGQTSEIEWKNRKVEPQPQELFEVPKGYNVTDLDELKKQMGAMAGMGGMVKGMAGGMAQGMGQGLGSSIGGSIGASVGGPLGAAAGQFIGGKIGGMLGKKAANTITH